jgi:serine kinase of HPr protein (carbohydrate metabolism regulator)
VHQYTGIAIGGRGVLIDGPSGSGKSALALALIDRGAVLIGDDGVSIEPGAPAPLASPPPNIAGLIEIRGVGIVQVPTARAPISLFITLDAHAPRHVERPATIDLAGGAVPHLRLYPDAATLPLRTEWALRLYGTPG